MDARFGLYPWIYANRKSSLFPLIEKYSGKSLKDMTHGEVINIYWQLLNNDQAFRADVDSIVAQKFKNATVAADPVNATVAADPVTAIAEAVGQIFKFGSSVTQKGVAMDSEFTSAVLAEQKQKNRQTLIIVGSVTLASLALIGVGVYLAVKKRRAK